MKHHFMFLFVISTGYAANQQQKEIHETQEKQKNTNSSKILQEVEQTIHERKISFLILLIALEWGYKGTDVAPSEENYNSAVQYVELIVETVMGNDNLTTTHKLNALKLKHIMKTLERATAHEEHIVRAKVLDEIVNMTSGNLSYAQNIAYEWEQNAVNDTVLTEIDIATELLLRSFSPPINYTHNSRQTNFEVERYFRKMERTMGAITFINTLLDPNHEIQINEENVVKAHPRDILQLIAWHVVSQYGNFPHVEDFLTEKPTTTKLKEATRLPLYRLYTDTSETHLLSNLIQRRLDQNKYSLLTQLVTLQKGGVNFTEGYLKEIVSDTVKSERGKRLTAQFIKATAVANALLNYCAYYNYILKKEPHIVQKPDALHKLLTGKDVILGIEYVLHLLLMSFVPMDTLPGGYRSRRHEYITFHLKKLKIGSYVALNELIVQNYRIFITAYIVKSMRADDLAGLFAQQFLLSNTNNIQ